MGGPDRYQHEAPLVGRGLPVAAAGVQVGRVAGVVIHPVPVAVPLTDGELGLGQCEGHYLAPLRADERRGGAGELVAGLVDVHLQGQRLPAVGVDQRRVARLQEIQRRIDRPVIAVCIAVPLIGAVLQAEFEQAAGDVVAQGGGRAGRIVGGGERPVMALCSKQRIDAGQCLARSRRHPEALPDDAVHGVADHLFPRRPQVCRRVHAVEGTGEPADRAAKQIGGRRIVERRPGVVHGNRRVEQVARMHRWTCIVVPDRLQQCLVPQAGHRMRVVIPG